MKHTKEWHQEHTKEWHQEHDKNSPETNVSSHVTGGVVAKTFSGTKENGPQVNQAQMTNANMHAQQITSQDEKIFQMLKSGKNVQEIASELDVDMGIVKAAKAKCDCK